MINKNKLVPLTVLSSVVLVLALAPAASAQAPVTGYAGQGGVAGTVATPTNPGNSGTAGAQAGNNQGVAGEAQESASNDLLPFTGMDLLAIIGGGLVLLASGVLISRIVARDPA
jgi:hypothetical protein